MILSKSKLSYTKAYHLSHERVSKSQIKKYYYILPSVIISQYRRINVLIEVYVKDYLDVSSFLIKVYQKYLIKAYLNASSRVFLSIIKMYLLIY